MCGIACYVGSSRKIKLLVDALEKLEYRGYDSAGVGFLENGQLNQIKSVGNIAKFKEKIDLNKNVSCAISHTRWATHGKVSKENAHPHFSKNSSWAVVHNGIIENYEKIKNKLNIIPKSETDTAVIAQLLEENEVDNIIEFIKVFQKIDGSYAVAAINNSNVNTLFLAKKNSPMFVAENNGDFLIVSDLVCIQDFSKNYFEINDNEFALVSNGKIKFYNSCAEVINKNLQQITDEFQHISKEKYQHFMIKEIYEEPQAIEQQIEIYKKQQILNKFDKDFIQNIKEIKFIGCGTAYHAGLVGAQFCEDLLNIPASAEVASEFVYKKCQFISNDKLYVFVSQSGETADTIKALDIVKNKNAKFISLTNVMHSTMAKKSQFILPVCAGVEIAVASTKAYVCQLTALYMFFSHLANVIKNLHIDFYSNLLSLNSKIKKINFSKFDSIAKYISSKKEVVFIGKGIDYVTAAEASLKLKEISYINSSEFMSGELKHGYLALVENDTPIFVFACNQNLNLKTMNAAEEARARGATIFYITNDITLKENKNVIFVDEKNPLLCAIFAIVPMQYLAYKVSVVKNINPDQPRNLAKSVTVE